MTEHDNLLKDFHSTGAPATRAEMSFAECESNVAIPVDLAEFLTTRGGCAGFVGAAYLRIWPLLESPEHNDVPQLSAEWPNLVLFGSDGSNRLYGLDRTTREYFRLEPVGDLEPHAMGRAFLEFLRAVTDAVES